MIDSDAALMTGGLGSLVAALSRLDENVDDAERIDQLAALERLKSAVAAAQVRVTVGFVASQEHVAHGWRDHAKTCADAGDFEGWRQARDHADRASLNEPDPPKQDPGEGKRSRRRPAPVNGVAAQVALARAESPHRGNQHLTLALTLHRHLPNVLAWLQAGVLSEWRATLIVRGCAGLSPELHQVLDAELADTIGEAIGRLGDRQLTRQVTAIAYRLDPESVLNRARNAEGDRRVSVRPAPDTMAYLTALLPVAHAVAAHAALTAAADTARAAGDQRGTGQVMADTLVERVTGQHCAKDVDVEVQVVITDGALFGVDDTPAQVPGYGTVPAGWVRDLLTPHDDHHDNDTDGTADIGDTGTEATQATEMATEVATGTDATRPVTDLSGRADTPAPVADADIDADADAVADADDRDDPVAAAPGVTAATDRGGGGGAGLREHDRVWLRRLYTHPATGTLIAMDSTRRVFDGGLRRYLLTRDAGTCRTPGATRPSATSTTSPTTPPAVPPPPPTDKGCAYGATTPNNSPASPPAPSPHQALTPAAARAPHPTGSTLPDDPTGSTLPDPTTGTPSS